MIKVDWDNVPEECKWAAQDENGNIYAYVDEPSPSGMDQDGVQYWQPLGRESAKQLSMANNDTVVEDWRESLVKRPVDKPVGYVKDTTDTILIERGSRYGKFKDLALIDQNLKAALHESPNWWMLDAHHQTALEMIAHKMSRILNGDPNYEDSWVDIAGYAKLGMGRNYD